MSETQEGSAAPEGADSTAEQHQLSRRAILRAGLVVVPVLMTLPVVPAWAQGPGVGGWKKKITNPTAASTYSTAKCDAQGGGTVSGHTCQPKPTSPPSGGAQADPFGASPFSGGSALGTSPFKKP